MKQARNKRLGFTLIEVLVALAVFSSVVSVVMFGLEQGRIEWRRTLTLSNSTGQLYQRFHWLEQTFNQVNSAPFIVDYSISAPHFYATENQVDFLTDAPILSGAGTYSAARLRVVNVEGEQALEFLQWPNSDPFYGIPKQASEENRFVVIRGIENAKWEYYLSPRLEATPMEIKFGNFVKREEGKWSSDYDSRYELKVPTKIRLSFHYRGDAYTWYFNLPPYTSATGQEEPLVIL
ncbi:prepilin-type N-terminal cleavage/methylation domain-containing protein [Vibrio vulnificus]|uniref:PulJ/GspJ family protein n=1 Tax=Vibrio vulnificus TaxID=672 RepID=UPI0029325B8E|nr:prepilin-type N-terminal cleavage/methylation domain-containing protein [Vibrio vulnificus]EKG2481238.1 prepilin-type N-terminal cleavage/methylation domain-containing protein [Vibrio vulnificus]ELP6769469.1 prepilin-type N-terminal cleavage/methylation domain-containing protein [Vibrio vulnificus]